MTVSAFAKLVTDQRSLKYPSENCRKVLLTRKMTLDDLYLRVYVPKKRIVVRDMTSNSDFMVNSVHEIGKAIRKAFSFIPESKTVHLFMDNAGGHGKIKVKEQYVETLKNEYNVEVEWQVSHSPETNMLDLGTWMALQSKVEYHHKRRVMFKDVLAKSVEHCWYGRDLNASILNKIHERWKLVLKLIVAGKGTNNLVEKHRGLKGNLVEMPSVPDSDDDEVVQKYDDWIGTEVVETINELEHLKL